MENAHKNKVFHLLLTLIGISQICDENPYTVHCHLFRDKKIIEFRNVSCLDDVISNFSTAPYQPYRVCALSPSLLLYVDVSQPPYQVHWLDCNSRKVKTGKTGAGIDQAIIFDMCYVTQENEHLLITTQGENGIYCHNLKTGNMEWFAKGKMGYLVWQMDLSGVTTDRHGRLFVCDTNNNCIQMFRTDGSYLGVLLRKGEQGLGSPHLISYCLKFSSLIVTQTTNAFKYYYLRVYSVQ